MTSAIASRRGPAVRRRGIVYGLRTLRPEDGYTSVEVGYAGQTRQRLRSREVQHREDQPFSDVIVGDAFVIAEGWWTDAELDAAELAAIRQTRPRYNIAGNEGNPDRVKPWVARDQRRERDEAAGRPVWQPRIAVPVGRSWWPCPIWQLWVLAWLPLWWVGFWWLFAAGVSVPGSTVGAAAGAGLLLGWGVRRGRRRRRRRRS